MTASIFGTGMIHIYQYTPELMKNLEFSKTENVPPSSNCGGRILSKLLSFMLLGSHLLSVLVTSKQSNECAQVLTAHAQVIVVRVFTSASSHCGF